MSWMRYRAIACAILGIMFILIAIAVTVSIYMTLSILTGIRVNMVTIEVAWYKAEDPCIYN